MKATISTDQHLNLGPLYAGLIFTAWAATHIFSVFFHPLSAPIWQTLGLIAFQCWLYTGVFIVAHDTMHGSLIPGKERLNAAIGTSILFVYAGFNWRKMREAHHEHHRYPGTEKDPDFNAGNPRAFWPWYMKFFLTYFGWRQVIVLVGFTLTYILLCLLYTSPSPRDKRQSRMPSSA